MNTECYPITVLPHVSALYRAYLSMGESDTAKSTLLPWYGCEPFGGKWMGCSVPGGAEPEVLADALRRQMLTFGGSQAALDNIDKLRRGARAVVTGQQVGLLGGPLLTLMKATTAIARARYATEHSGIQHVPVFWLATEDHDLPEVDTVSLLTKTSVETLRAGLRTPGAVPVGGVEIGPEIDAVLNRAQELLEFAPLTDVLRDCYGARDGQRPTLGLAFARWMCHVFAGTGLIVMDASGREFHRLGAATLRYAIEQADDLQAKLLERSKQLERSEFHAQVMVVEDGSQLFLVDDRTGERQALRRTGAGEGEGGWKAGSRLYSTADLLRILEDAPERLSPNALLRPVFQDTLLPTAAYVGGPAEVAYFAQSAVIYEATFGPGRITPVLPRFTATLLEPGIATVMDRHEVRLPDAMTTAGELAQRLGARAMPIAVKRRLAGLGNAVEVEASALTEYLGGMDVSLGKSAEVSTSKMLYQMNRLRRMAATFELQKEASLGKHALAITLNVFPEGTPQERLIAGAWYLARYGEDLIERLVAAAADQCPGHVVIRL